MIAARHVAPACLLPLCLSGFSSVGMKANGSTGAGAGDGAGGGGGGDDDDASSPGKDNQLYGVLEALLDLRCAARRHGSVGPSIWQRLLRCLLQ